MLGSVLSTVTQWYRQNPFPAYENGLCYHRTSSGRSPLAILLPDAEIPEVEYVSELLRRSPAIRTALGLTDHRGRSVDLLQALMDAHDAAAPHSDFLERFLEAASEIAEDFNLFFEEAPLA